MSNFRSLFRKQDHLCSYVESCSADIVLGTETWLSLDISDHELSLSREFSLFRKDRVQSRGGGVLVAVKNSLEACVIETNSCLEILWIALCLPARTTCVIGVCYRPPDSSHEFPDYLNESLSFVQDKYPTSPIFLAGDFNYPNIEWQSCRPLDGTRKRECQYFLDVLSSFDLHQIVSAPTRNDSLLDLILTTEPNNVSVNVLDGISDHNILHCAFVCALQKRENRAKVIFDYNRANVDGLITDLSAFSIDLLQSFHQRDVNTNWALIRDKLITLKEKHIPRIKITTCTQSAWFTTHVKRTINKKKRLYSKAKLSASEEDWRLYREHAHLCRIEITTAKDKFFNYDISNMLRNDTKKFWKVIKPNYATNSTVSLSKDGNILSPARVAAEFNEFFSSVFTDEAPVPSDLEVSILHSNMLDITITPEGIHSCIDRLPANAAPGPDGICPKLLKISKPAICDILAALFQQSIDTGCVPNDWKEARVIPIFKSGDPSNPSNYRPISLTSTCCKLLEHIISSALMKFLTEHNFFFINQHGFLHGRSCETQLFELINDLHHSVHCLHQIDAIFVDFAKAFDKVPHLRLVHKLTGLNINTKVVRWITNFLANRYQSVFVNDHLSPLIHVKSGVPQGSVLGPILFLVYINDISNGMHSTVRLFADDCVIYRQISNPQDTSFLQSDLENLSKWCNNWQMQINVNKTKAITFGTTANLVFYDYTLNNMPIDSVSTIKYLGVHLSSDLSWNTHIDAIVSKASRSLGFIRRNLHPANSETKLLAYKTLVRSKLEYASFIWNPHQAYLKQKLESVQNKAARFITKNYLRTSSVTEIKSSLNLAPLENRRLLTLLSFFHKLHFNQSSHDIFNIRPARHISSRLDHQHKIEPIFARTNLFFHSPLLLAIREWNLLPADIVRIVNHDSFVTSLKSFLGQNGSL